jgi:hypothetical protein
VSKDQDVPYHFVHRIFHAASTVLKYKPLSWGTHGEGVRQHGKTMVWYCVGLLSAVWPLNDINSDSRVRVVMGHMEHGRYVVKHVDMRNAVTDKCRRLNET